MEGTFFFAELSGGGLREGVPGAPCVLVRCSERFPKEKRWLAEITAPWNIQKHLARVSSGRAAGLDGIPIELIVAGGLPALEMVSKVFDCLIEHARAPAQWRGRRLPVLWKKTGDSAICSNSSGILIVITVVNFGLLSWRAMCLGRVDSHLTAGTVRLHARSRTLTNISPDQSLPLPDAVVLANQLAFCFWTSARLLTRSCVKHFGMGSGEIGVETHLLGLGLSEAAAEHMAAYIDKSGGLLRKIGVPDVIAELVADLHDGAWFHLTLTGLLHGAETWTRPSWASLRDVNTFVMASVRRITHEPRVPWP